MLKFKTFIFAFLLVGTISSCKKAAYNPDEQLVKDDAIIKDFISQNSIPAIKHSSGLYYQIINPGSGTPISVQNNVFVTYEGKLLNGKVFDKSASTVELPLSRVILGWQIGIPLIRKGGKIRLIVPSVLAYRNESPSRDIPENSILDFTVDLINAQ
ncbi:MAG: peptidylprolyl isomerase [Pedobacter sp.]|nr:MAG: peptidylprolyl isomerase [Pedobacter sp.]